MSELVIRFLIGGVIVSLFAMIGEVLRPKSFLRSVRGRSFNCFGDNWSDDP
jgi:hypothetical protein